MTGLVSLVGAGPGDPGLLTLRAAQRLQGADLVLYDALVSADTLALARRAQRFCVGKRAGGRFVRQEVIERLMIRHARRGKQVVRLKGGDPFVFGRGGEEALALARAGVRVEIVPGVSACVAAPALAGIPVTHRGLASAFLVVSGHDESAYGAALGGVRANALTLVVLMGRESRQRLASMLLARGWDARTPAAVIAAASTSAAFTWVGRLEELGESRLPEALRGAPATIVVGNVAGLAAAISPALGARSDTPDAASCGRARRAG